MRIGITCECGNVVDAESSAAGGTARCPVCGRQLAVPASSAVSPQVVSARPVAAAQPGGGLAIASMVLGIMSLVGAFCLAPLGLVLAIVALILGTVALIKRGGGRGMAIAGVSLGGASLILSLVMVAFFALPLLVFMRARPMRPPPRPPATMAASPVFPSPPEAGPAPLVFDAEQVSEALTGALRRPRDAAKAAANLAAARALFPRRRAKAGALYRCVEHFRLHLAHRGGGAFEREADRLMFEMAGEELVDDAVAAYRRAGELQQDGKWAEAVKELGRLEQMVPERSNPLRQNVEAQRNYCRRMRAAAD